MQSGQPSRGALAIAIEPPALPSSPLFPSPDTFAGVDRWLSDQLAGAQRRVAQGPPLPTFNRDLFAADLARFDFLQPCDLRAVMSWLIEQLEHGLVQVAHPRYFGLFNPAPSFPSQCADRVASSFNPQLATYTTSPVAVDVESHVIANVAKRAGLPDTASGHFTSGGSEANCTALLCALTAANADFATSGARCFSGQPTLYISRDAHLAWIKIAHQVGIGRNAVRLVSTDGQGRMSGAELEHAIADDLTNGCVPILVVGTAGTTGAGMVDPLIRCGEIARGHGIWFHVDAAWAGAAIASQRLRPLLEGIETSDSMTIDAHKWLATTMGCGMFLTRRPDVLSDAFSVQTTFMPSNLRHLDPYVTSAQWSRRFIGVRLFASLATVGWEGYAAHVERAVDVARLLNQELTKRHWKVVNDSPVAVLCVEPPAASPEVQTIVRRVLASGRAFVSVTEFEGRQVIRACITHGETSSDDIAVLVDTLEDARSAR